MNQFLSFSLPAIAAAGLLSFVIGFVWYTFLFSKPWMKAMGLNIEDVQSSGLSSVRAIIASLAASLTTAAGLAVIFTWYGAPSLALGLGIAATIWVAFSLTPMFKLIFWEDRSATLFTIDGGYELASIMSAALVLLLWP